MGTQGECAALAAFEVAVRQLLGGVSPPPYQEGSAGGAHGGPTKGGVSKSLRMFGVVEANWEDASEGNLGSV